MPTSDTSDTDRPTRKGRRWWPAALIAAILLAGTAGTVGQPPADDDAETISLTALLAGADDGRWESATVDADTTTVTVTSADGDDEQAAAFTAGTSDVVVDRLLDAQVDVTLEPASPTPLWADLARTMLPLLIIVGLLLFLLRGQGGLGRFTSSKVVEAVKPDVRFDDVAGVDEVVDELADIVAYLRDPSDWDRVGARPPRGVLLTGPPGTGKTLLAKAMAGEAGVPFYDVAGSGFVEMFVGVGARRVKNVFEQAAKADAAVVFIDEIDAVGKSRVSGVNTGASEERENTLNELLVQLDGFTDQDNIIVIGATNRPDVLDDALTRPGRFDRKVVVPPPDRAGRRRILDVHAAGKPLDDDVDLDLLATRTLRYTGAQLADIVREAAREAAREGTGRLHQRHFDAAVSTVSLGRERRSMEVLDEDRRVTAWHEAGHTVAALLHDEVADPLQVSIVPRGVSGGHTSLSGDDRVFMSRPAAHAQLQVALGGRAAEVLQFGDRYTQGAAHDVEAATRFATQMAAEWGMSRLGMVHVPEQHRQVGVMADRLADVISEMIADAYDDVYRLLDGNRALLDVVARRLLDEENLDRDQLRALACR